MFLVLLRLQIWAIETPVWFCGDNMCEIKNHCIWKNKRLSSCYHIKLRCIIKVPAKNLCTNTYLDLLAAFGIQYLTHLSHVDAVQWTIFKALSSCFQQGQYSRWKDQFNLKSYYFFVDLLVNSKYFLFI